MTAGETAAEVLNRDAPVLATAWRQRCAEVAPGSPPAPSVARAFVASVADAMGVADPDADEVGVLLRSPLEFDPDAAVSVEQVAALREVLHRHLTTELPSGEVMPAVEALSHHVDALLVAVTERAFRRLEAAAFLDPLTGVGNRRALDRDAAPLLATARRHGRPLSVIVIDLDFLKRLNDSEGHAAGDEAIRRLAAALSRHLRSGDSIYRVGGDEFVLVLPETRPADVGPLLQRAIGQAPPFSYGVAGFPDDGLGLDQLVDAADQELLEHRRRTRGGDAGRSPRRPSEERPAPPKPPEALRRIEAMAWPEREIEERLYTIADVLAARVSDDEVGLHVGVLVRPTTDTAALPEAVLDSIEAAAGAVPAVVDLRIMPLGSTAESRVLRPMEGRSVVAPPAAPASPRPGSSEPAAEPSAGGEARAAAPVQSGPIGPSPLPDADADAGAAAVAIVAPRPLRTILTRISALHEGPTFAAEVTLQAGERVVTGTASGMPTRQGTSRVVAEATTDALDQLDPGGRHRRGIEWVEILSSPSGQVAVVGVALVGPVLDAVVSGSASVGGRGPLDAVARAVLDATNRGRQPPD